MAATKAAKEKAELEASEKAAQEKAAIESDSDNEAEMRAEREKMKAGAVRVGKQYSKTDAVRIKGGGVSVLFVDSHGEGGLVHGPVKAPPAADFVGVHVSVQFDKGVTVARCYNLRVIISACRLLGKGTKRPASKQKNAVECCIGD